MQCSLSASWDVMRHTVQVDRVICKIDNVPFQSGLGQSQPNNKIGGDPVYYYHSCLLRSRSGLTGTGTSTVAEIL